MAAVMADTATRVHPIVRRWAGDGGQVAMTAAVSNPGAAATSTAEESSPLAAATATAAAPPPARESTARAAMIHQGGPNAALTFTEAHDASQLVNGHPIRVDHAESSTIRIAFVSSRLLLKEKTPPDPQVPRLVDI
jgi:hypothetical protein